MITYDEPKRLANLDEHKLDFAEFEAGFDFDTAVVVPTYPSRRTGRARVKAIGMFKGRVVVAILSPLGTEAMSIVSLRIADKQERALYENR